MATIIPLIGNVPQIRPARRITRDDGYLHRRLNSVVFIPSGCGALIPLHINCLSLPSPTRHFLWGERCLLEPGASGSGLQRNTDAREQRISILVEPVTKALFTGKHSCICSSFSRNQSRHWPSTFPSIALNDRTFCLSKPRLDNAAHTISNPVTSQRNIACSTLQESSTSTVAEDTNEVNTAPKAAPGKPKVPAKAPAKPLPQMMEEDVIPPLKAILETQDELSDIELSFQDNKLEGSFLKKGNPYIFWAFFPNGVLTGPKGFSLSSYGSGASTVEPFLIDEKKITANLIVFWIEKRLAAQGIIPVWKD